MRVLLDECVPKRLRRSLTGHVAKTVPEMGWSGKKNGQLISLMLANGFDLLLTVDKGIVHQQSLTTGRISVVVMDAVTNRTADLLPLIPNVLLALDTILPDQIVTVTA